jgi:hypothetical protein
MTNLDVPFPNEYTSPTATLDLILDWDRAATWDLERCSMSCCRCWERGYWNMVGYGALAAGYSLCDRCYQVLREGGR